MAIYAYSIGGYWWLLIAIGGYSINGYLCIFYWWILVVINSYWWLFY
jgi:hypothetical protein